MRPARLTTRPGPKPCASADPMGPRCVAPALALLGALVACSADPVVPAPPSPPAVELSTPDPRVEAAAQAVRAGDYLQARLEVAEGMALRPSDRLRVLRALALVAQGSFDEAGTDLQTLLEASPGDAGVAVAQAHLALARREHARAETLLQPVLDGPAPGQHADGYVRMVHEMAWLGQGWAAANQARHADAVDAFERVLASSPDHVLALLGHGNALSGLRRLDEAEAGFRRVLELEPGNPYAMAELGLVQYNRGEDERAQASFEAALAVQPERYTCPHEGLGLVWLRQGQTEKARAAFEQAIRINPDIEYKKYNGLARILLDEGRVDEARALLVKSVENYPHDDEARALLADLDGASPVR
jgi:tetratricopeptide (TPR) repeat protein